MRSIRDFFQGNKMRWYANDLLKQQNTFELLTLDVGATEKQIRIRVYDDAGELKGEYTVRLDRNKLLLSVYGSRFSTVYSYIRYTGSLNHPDE
ncbi:hypothetical protein KTO58_28295 [Chitinophaga pendula]|uniref:hypothetical protein n=1 Tax=Chitinophaga TaxID=79328 RepID=UPI000BB01D9A|nr:MULTISPECIES: hypothetical protein [Chitinophaga]ASZ09552.1 hypothetical protein CK934_00445 [Chitinophaga sp. MD30]UCJ07514.1 hypothetical protein KTO58_28295 [Chitinophaga pendula]